MAMKIVVGVDGSTPSFVALRWAVHEARRRDAEVRVISCYEVPAYGGPNGASYPISIDMELLEGAAAAVVGRAIEVAGEIDPDVVVDGATPQSPPVSGITESAGNDDEIVVGATGHSGLIAGLLGSVATGVAHRAHVPVVVVPAASPSEFGTAMNKIVVGVDGSPESVAALDWAYGEALLSGAELTVVHAWKYPYSLTRSSSREVLEPMEFDAAKELQDSVESLGQRSAGGPVVVHSKLCEEWAVAALLDVGHDADLVVVGSRGRGGFRSRLLGSVSRTLAEHATGPVALIRRAAV